MKKQKLIRMDFDELVAHGLSNGANVVGGMPWSWKINGRAITQENDNCYIIETDDGYKHFERGDHLYITESGLHITFKSNSEAEPGE